MTEFPSGTSDSSEGVAVEQIATDSLPTRVEQPAVPVRLNTVYPWHRPRKQYIRTEQWLNLSRRLIERELRSGRVVRRQDESYPEIKYLTLPGIDYLDVRMLSDVCRELDCELTSTSFLSGEEANPHVARARVQEEALVESGHITRRSHTYSRKIEEAASQKGQVYRDLRTRGPFHIVNIDACGSISSPQTGSSMTVIDALFRIVELQLEMMVGRWMLFVTTDVRQDNVSEETMAKFCEEIRSNAGENQEFGESVVSILAPESTNIDSAIDVARRDSESVFLRLFSIGFGKWLLQLVRQKNWGVKMHTSYCYSTTPIGDNTPTMPCLAFEFVPPPPGLRDESGVTRVEPREGGSEEDLSSRIASKVQLMKNLDELLLSDNDLRRELVEQTKTLLREIGYEDKALDELDRQNEVESSESRSE